MIKLTASSLNDELRSYRTRAYGLKRLGEEAIDSIECRRKAREEYAALKSHFSERLKKLAQARCEGSHSLDELVLLDALKEGYRAMRATQHASPLRRVWTSSVQDLYSRMDYHVGHLEVELDELEKIAADLLKFSTPTLKELNLKVDRILNFSLL